MLVADVLSSNLVVVFVGIIGSLCSIFGAVVSARAAKQARAAKDSAWQLADQIRFADCAKWLEQALRSSRVLMRTGQAARGRDNQDLLGRIEDDIDQAFLAIPETPRAAALRTALDQTTDQVTSVKDSGTTSLAANRLCDTIRNSARLAKNLASRADRASP